jgi:anti-sigma-K factor RskA
MSETPTGDDDLLAAELAFGLIDGEERLAAERRLDRDPAFAAAHGRWQSYAAGLFSGPGEAPRPSLWNEIAAQLPANDVGVARGSLRWWQAGTLAASAAALVLAVIALRTPHTVFVRVPVAAPATAPMVAVLTGKTGFATVSFDPATGRLTSAANGLDLKAHSPELWVIPADGKPRSLGVMNAVAPGWGKIPARASAVMAASVTIAISVEPVGGSPTGQPTGPVILAGKLTPT